MSERIQNVVDFLLDLEQLKLVTRNSYASDRSRHENAAEHSWHLALGLLIVARELDLEIDLLKALCLALVHDLGEIDAGDVSIYAPDRGQKTALERRCIERLAAYGVKFGPELQELWDEYEAQESRESRWVRVLDRLMPFIINLVTEGQSWRDQGITRTQVLRVNEPVRELAPEIFSWVVKEIERSVHRGWLRDA